MENNCQLTRGNNLHKLLNNAQIKTTRNTNNANRKIPEISAKKGKTGSAIIWARSHKANGGMWVGARTGVATIRVQKTRRQRASQPNRTEIDCPGWAQHGATRMQRFILSTRMADQVPFRGCLESLPTNMQIWTDNRVKQKHLRNDPRLTPTITCNPSCKLNSTA
jgi:hypothetical protein